MYLSHPVRRIRDDPHPDEEVGLVVELAEDATDAALDDLRDAVADAGGCVDRDLGFDAHRVVVPEVAVADLCALDGVARIETDATISLDVDSVEGDGDEADHTVEDLRDHLENGENEP